MWLFPYLTYVTILGIVTILIAMAFIDHMRSQLALTLLIVLIVIGSYYLFHKNNERKVGIEEVKDSESIHT
ncbi:L-asparagine transporter-like permease [Oikeobacillus pervagus]|uniref:L-asparagine transporter-like permease n=1 Tax=Oikeobacillus pervagus TaxID=1325931 RepID=A0AAJ1T0C0_9BACI|nr:L-asparagine transporter-like permease [Oikeobacillus pervagus]